MTETTDSMMTNNVTIQQTNTTIIINSPLQSNKIKPDRVTVSDGQNDLLTIESPSAEPDCKLVTLLTDEQRLLTPKADGKSTFYENKPDQLPLKKTVPLLFHYLVFEINSIIISLEIESSAGFSLSHTVTHPDKYLITFPSGSKTVITTTLFTSLHNHVKTAVKSQKQKFLLPTWAHSPGFSIDCLSDDIQSVSFTGVRQMAGIDSMNVLIRNWSEANNRDLTPVKRPDRESLLQKIKIADMPAILEINTRIRRDTNRSLPVMRMRNGSVIVENNQSELDYFHDAGMTALHDMVQHEINSGCSALLGNPPHATFTDPNLYAKAICKSKGRHIEYKKQVREGFERLNQAVSKSVPNNCVWMASVCSRELHGAIYLHKAERSTQILLTAVYDRFIQGYVNSGLIVDESITGVSSRELSRLITTIMFIARPLFFDLKCLTTLLKHPKLTQDRFNKLIIWRSRFKLLYEYLLQQMIIQGTLPVQPYTTEVETAGFFFGNLVYLSFIEERFLRRSVTLPEGRWYNPEHRQFIGGPGKFSVTEQSQNFMIWISENSIVPLYKDQIKGSMLPLSTEFIIYPSDKTLLCRFVEHYLDGGNPAGITHSVKVSSSDTSHTCIYSSTDTANIGRYITFTLVHSQALELVLINGEATHATEMNKPGTSSVECVVSDKEIIIEYRIMNKTGH